MAHIELYNINIARKKPRYGWFASGRLFLDYRSVDMQNAAGYCERIPHLMRELKTKSLSEAERDRNITKLDYLGIGYGYNFKSNYPKNMKQAAKDTQTPELSKLEKLIEAIRYS